MRKRRTLQSMTDAELDAERKSLSNVAGKWAARRYSRILDEQIRREGDEPVRSLEELTEFFRESAEKMKRERESA